MAKEIWELPLTIEHGDSIPEDPGFINDRVAFPAEYEKLKLHFGVFYKEDYTKAIVYADLTPEQSAKLAMINGAVKLSELQATNNPICSDFNINILKKRLPFTERQINGGQL